jgi:hypothetical protein
MNSATGLRFHFLAVGFCALGLQLGTCQAPAQANPLTRVLIAQIPAFLPMSSVVPMTEDLPIDGEWMISTIGKRIRIEAGRAYAVDPWTHMFVLRIQPSMVVFKDMKRTGPGEYSGYDLPLMGTLTARLQPDGSLSVSVQGALIPVQYTLLPVTIDDPDSFEMEKTGQYDGSDDEQDSDDKRELDEDQEEPGRDEPPVDPDAGEAPVSPWGG